MFLVLFVELRSYNNEAKKIGLMGPPMGLLRSPEWQEKRNTLLGNVYKSFANHVTMQSA